MTVLCRFPKPPEKKPTPKVLEACASILISLFRRRWSYDCGVAIIFGVLRYVRRPRKDEAADRAADAEAANFIDNADQRDPFGRGG